MEAQVVINIHSKVNMKKGLKKSTNKGNYLILKRLGGMRLCLDLRSLGV